MKKKLSITLNEETVKELNRDWRNASEGIQHRLDLYKQYDAILGEMEDVIYELEWAEKNEKESVLRWTTELARLAKIMAKI